MEKKFVYQDEASIDYIKLFTVLFEYKKLVLIISSVFFGFSLLVALLIPNKYTSETILAPSNPSQSLSGAIGGVAALASLGMGLPNDGADKTPEAIERIKSFNFFSNYFLPNIQLEDLLATKSWDEESNKLQYNSSDFHEESNKWVRDFEFPQAQIPSDQEAYEEYEDILVISQDKTSQFVYISIEHLSPYIAKEWLDIIILEINERMREEDQKLANNSINFLNNSLKETNLAEMQEAIADLLHKQMEKLMLASANENYIFKVIESPIAPEIESSPNRLVIMFIGSLFGLVIGILSSLIINYKKYISNEDKNHSE
jgi:LPS O-antigen subunit length determinant protein (WzzB/FepE family)